MLPELTTEVVGIIIDRTGWNEDEAISRFMRSEVYNRLQDETTKTWHHSPSMLADLFEDEQNGRLVWPEGGRWITVR